MANDQVNLSVSELDQLIKAVSDYANDLTEKFIIPCSNAVSECGLEGAFKAEVDELADRVKANLTSVVNQLAEDTGNKNEGGSVLDALKGLKERVEERISKSNFKGVNDSLEQATATHVETGRRGKRKS